MGQVGLLHRVSGPLLDRAREVVLVLDEPLGAEELYALVVAVGRPAADLSIVRK